MEKSCGLRKVDEERQKSFFFGPKFGPPLPNDNFPRLIERACAADGKILLLYFWPHSLSSSPEKRSGNDAVCYPENRPSFEVADADLSFKSIPFLPSRSNRWSTAHSLQSLNVGQSTQNSLVALVYRYSSFSRFVDFVKLSHEDAEHQNVKKICTEEQMINVNFEL